MIRYSLAGIVLLITSAISPPAFAAREPLRLSPTSPWQVNYSDDSCRMARQFGVGDTESYIVFDRYQPGDSFRLMVFGKPFEKARSGRDATIRFGPNESEQELGYLRGKMTGLPAIVFFDSVRIAPGSEAELAEREKSKKSDNYDEFEFAPIDPSREEAATFLSVDAPGAREVILETGSLGKPFNAFRQCMDNLLEHWGIDVEAHELLTRKVVPATSPATWLTSADYPSAMERTDSEGIVHVRLDVASDGRPTGCHIQETTDPEGFNDVVCSALMRRAKFEPALDAQGKAIASFYVTSVRFLIR